MRMVPVSSALLACLFPFLVACGQSSPSEPSMASFDGSSQASASASSAAGQRRGLPTFQGEQPNAKFSGVVVDVAKDRFTLADGTIVIVDGKTEWSMTGDIFSIEEMAAARDTKGEVVASGEGIEQTPGAILATLVVADITDTK